MASKLAVIAIGGNSLIEDPNKPQIEHQWVTVRKTCDSIAEMIATGWQVVLTHGNGPQVGFIIQRGEAAVEQGMHDIPMDLVVADTQGSIGYMFQKELDNALRLQGINQTIVTVVTQVRVNAQDPAFQNPTKPIGSYLNEDQATHYENSGWHVKEDAGRGKRRVIASPLPLNINEINAIRSLMKEDYIVIACGGGGIPVIRDEQGALLGIAAVIDKDHASSLLARELRADLFIICTGVSHVAVHFNTAEQQSLDRMTIKEAEQYIEEGHFAPGSMLPKIQAAVDFVRLGGPQALITDPHHLHLALRGHAGTRIVPG
ncbi:MAG: carbamate kinase [Chloroflexi bacterium]|nr:carbamate kinase [Chloroflexota bacterium]